MIPCTVKGCPRPAIVRPLIKVWSTITPVSQRTDKNCATLTPNLPHCRECWEAITTETQFVRECVEVASQAVGQMGKAPMDKASAVVAYEHILTNNAEKGW